MKVIAAANVVGAGLIAAAIYFTPALGIDRYQMRITRGISAP